MRQRRIKNLDEKLENLSYLTIKEPEALAGTWREAFQNTAETLALEIGCGKGQFIRGMALAHPDWNFIAIEGHQSVVLHAMEKVEESQIANVRFILQYLNNTTEIFRDSELDRIYMNFSDPWPKDRHAKRRLTHEKRLREYVRILKKGGIIEFRTDNQELFDFSLTQFALVPELKMCECTRDFHKNVQIAPESGDITTEYEDKFVDLGKSICYLRAEIMK